MQLLIELFDDGGIRVVPPSGRPGIATSTEMLKWVQVAVSEGHPIRVAGRVSSPHAQSVITLLPDGLDRLTIEEAEPAPWKVGRL